MALYFNIPNFGNVGLAEINYGWYVNGWNGAGSGLIRSDVPFTFSISPYNLLYNKPVGAYVPLLTGCNKWTVWGSFTPSDIGIIKTSEDEYGFYIVDSGTIPVQRSTAPLPFLNAQEQKCNLYIGCVAHGGDSQYGYDLFYATDAGTYIWEFEWRVAAELPTGSWESSLRPANNFVQCTYSDTQLGIGMVGIPSVRDFECTQQNRTGYAGMIIYVDITSAEGGASSGLPIDYEGGATTSDYGNGTWSDYGDSYGFDLGYSSPLRNCGLVAIFNPTQGQLSALASWLNSSGLWDNVQKTWSDPLDCIISLAMFPVVPSNVVAQSLVLGGIDTEITMNRLVGNDTTVKISFGSIDLKEYFGSFEDYAPYTDLSIYLPYIGFKQLNVNDYMNGRISLQYAIDFLNGDCIAEIIVTDANTGESRPLDVAHGNVAIQVPLTSTNYIGAYASIVQGIQNIGNADIAGLANTILAPKVQTARGGNISGNSGAMSPKRAYITIDRPQKGQPTHYNRINGKPLNTGGIVSQYSGFTKGKIEVICYSCTESEKERIKALFESGVYL